MAIHTESLTITTTAAEIVSAAVSGGGLNRTGILSNTSAGTIYVGGPDVTTSNGFAVGSGASFPFELRYGDDLWAVAGSSLTVDLLYDLA